jgi:hypothetical protein
LSEYLYRINMKNNWFWPKNLVQLLVLHPLCTKH